MPLWIASVELGDLYRKYEAGEMTIQEVAKTFAKRLVEVRNGNPELKRIIRRFQRLGKSENATPAQWDRILSDLYDWADVNRLWINPYVGG